MLKMCVALVVLSAFSTSAMAARARGPAVNGTCYSDRKCEDVKQNSSSCNACLKSGGIGKSWKASGSCIKSRNNC
jgi:hypothetical protein